MTSVRRKVWAAVGAAGGLAGLLAAGWLLVGPSPPDWERADAVVVYSLDAGDGPGEGRPADPPDRERLYGFAVLGKVDVPDPAVRRRLARAFAAATAGRPTPLKCFRPRHAVRVVRAGVPTDTLICFECHTYEVHPKTGPGGTPGIRPDAQAAFDAVLAAAGVPAAPAR